jgi:hypothetical protein
MFESSFNFVHHVGSYQRECAVMNCVAALTLGLLVSSSAMAGHHDEVVINSESELQDWCKQESEATLIGRGLTPFNWTASQWNTVDTLMVKGEWRTSGTNSVVVECSVARGAQARSATLSIHDSR